MTDAEVATLTERLSNAVDALAKATDKLDKLAAKLDDTTTRVSALETRVDLHHASHATDQATILSRLDRHDARLDTLDKNQSWFRGLLGLGGAGAGVGVWEAIKALTTSGGSH